MSDVIWWFGFIHLAAYGLLGTVFVLTWVIWKLHTFGRFNGRIVQWHIARWRWKRRHQDGLTDAEWQSGEPRP